MSRIVDFYLGNLKHPLGVSIDSIWRWDTSQLEYEHSYIQWLFPLHEQSSAVPNSPILMMKDIERFDSSKDLRDRLRKSLVTMLGFYGFGIKGQIETGESLSVVRSSEFAERSSKWLSPNNHNFLRITRILRSCTLLGLSAEAKEFFAVLQRVYIENQRTIGETTYDYWKKAIEL